MKIISVQNVSKAYKYYPTKWMRILEKIQWNNTIRHYKKWVLCDINFTIDSGESVGIVGINGSGKSTLLKLLTGTTKPTKGSIIVQGSIVALLELGMGFHPDFSGRQNAYMAGLMQGISRNLLTKLISEIEKFADIGEFFELPVRIYSSGMQMRLAFAVATVTRPDILIIDEALSVGDARFQAKCYERIADFKRNGSTLLLVSHNIVDIAKHCDRAIFLKNGYIEIDSTARKVTNCYLNEIFNKPIANNITTTSYHAVSEIKNLNNNFYIDGNQDIFCTRPGYRPEEYRWGRGGARIIDYIILSGNVEYPSYIISNQYVDIVIKVLFDYDYDNIVPGLLLKTLDGVFLYGTNSFLASKGKEYITASKGDIKLFKFSFSLSLNKADYLLSLGVSTGNPELNMIPLDRRYDAIIIHVSHKMEFSGLVDLNATFHYIKK